MKYIFIFILFLSLSSAQAFQIQSLDLKLKLDEDSSSLKAEAQLAGIPDGAEDYFVFFLGRNFTIKDIKVKGAAATWARAEEVSPPIGSRGSLAYEVHIKTKRKPKNYLVQISYSGKLDGLVNSSDIISKNLVELTRASGYYPHTRTVFAYYKIEIDCDKDFRWATIGRITRARPNESTGRAQMIWDGFSPPRNDIVLVGSPSFKVTGGASAGLALSCYHTVLDSLSPQVISEMMFLTDYFRDKFGPPPRRGTVIWVRSPRVGRSYVRPPLFVSPAGSQMKIPSGQTATLLSELLGNLWWGESPSDPSLCLGLAEYSAWKAVENMAGDSAVIPFRKEARERISAMVPEDEIILRGLKLAWALHMLDLDRNVQLLIKDLAPAAQSGTLFLNQLEAALEKLKPLPDWWTPIVRQDKIPDFALRANVELDKRGGAVVKGKLWQVGENNFHLPIEVEIKSDYATKIIPLTMTGKDTDIQVSVDFVPTEIKLDPKEKILHYQP